MHPPLSTKARDALRALGSRIDVYASLFEDVDVSTHDEIRAAVGELVAFDLLRSNHRRDGTVALSVAGARVLLDILAADALKLPCRCGHTREEHGDASPHPCYHGAGIALPAVASGELSDETSACGCRSFTPAEPVYRPAPDPPIDLAAERRKRAVAAASTLPPSPEPEHVRRMLREFRPGDRVVAALRIVYGLGPEVPQGTLGTVCEHPDFPSQGALTGCALVDWDGIIGRRFVTGCDSLDPAPDGARRR